MQHWQQCQRKGLYVLTSRSLGPTLFYSDTPRPMTFSPHCDVFASTAARIVCLWAEQRLNPSSDDHDLVPARVAGGRDGK
jgi:hypothetical protein